jgi:tetratricopeptide (TPR) repeat protein
VAEDTNLEGLFGGEAGGEQASASRGGSADALALAAALQAARDPELSRAASDYLAAQKHLVQLQIRHVDEELRLAIAAAKRKRYSDRIRNTLATLVALLVLGLVLAGVRLTVEALRDHSLVVDRFSVPADLAAQGLTPEALADSLVSRIGEIRDVANRNSFNVTEEVRGAAAGSVRVEIPQTGVSLDEVEHFAHRWLGHEVLVTGSVRDEGGDELVITLHIAGAEPINVKGSRSDLEGLIQQAAERAFENFDAVNYVIYLQVRGRGREAYEANLRAVRRIDERGATPRELGNIYSLLAAMDPDPHRAYERLLTSIDLDPKLTTGQIEGARMSESLGHDQAMFDFAGSALRTRVQDQPAQLRPGYPFMISEAQAYRDRALGDFAALRTDYDAYRNALPQLYSSQIEVDALLHDDLNAARAYARLSSAVGIDDDRIARASWYLSYAKGDWPSAASAAKTLVDAKTAGSAPAPNSASELKLQTLDRPHLAEAELMLGDLAAAARDMASSPQDCYLCTQLRARIAAAGGDWAQADRLFADSVRQAPDLPAAYFRWGESLIGAGRYAEAAQKLSLAHERGPRFADPLKAWGDALAKQGQLREAVSKYDQALKYAPGWTRLKSARDAAAHKIG